MLKLLADESVSGHLIGGLLRKRPQIDLVRVQDELFCGVKDPAILAWAADHDRIVLSRDKATMPDFADERIDRGEAMPGVIVMRNRTPISRAIDELIMIDECSEHSEYANRVVFIPF